MKLLGWKLLCSAPLPGGEVFTAVTLRACRERCALRRADRYTVLAAAAVLKLFEENQLSIPAAAGERTALVTVTALGPHATVFATLDDILDYPEDEILPTRFSHSVHNAAAGYLCQAFGVRGAVFALNGMENSFHEALLLAETLLRNAVAERVLLVGVEENGLLPSQAFRFAPRRFRPQLNEGALAFLLEGGEGAGRRGCVEVASEPDRDYREQIFAFGATRGNLTELAEAGPESRIVWR